MHDVCTHAASVAACIHYHCSTVLPSHIPGHMPEPFPSFVYVKENLVCTAGGVCKERIQGSRAAAILQESNVSVWASGSSTCHVSHLRIPLGLHHISAPEEHADFKHGQQ